MDEISKRLKGNLYLASYKESSLFLSIFFFI